MEDKCLGKTAIFFSLSMLTACSSHEFEKKEMLQKEGNWLGDAEYFKPSTLQKKFSSELRNGTSPQIGLSLAGGGTKASSFSIGILKGLDETKLINRIDTVSSVSGGGYAALWYYTRIQSQISKNTAPTPEAINTKIFFDDCYPSRYIDKEDNSTEFNSIEICPGENHTNYLSKNNTDPWLHQNYLRGFQDVFSSDQSLMYESAFNYNPTGKDNRFTWDAATMTLQSLTVLPLGLLVNGVFDWELDVSITQNRYNHGIARAYAGIPRPCDKEGCEYADSKTIRKIDDTGLGIKLSFDQLKFFHTQIGAPLWIINATAGENRSPWDATPQADINLSLFEITPYGSGSGLYGYKNGQLPEITPYRAILASAAFLDSQQKVLLEPPARNIAASLMDITTFSWGSSYRNNFSEQPAIEEQGNFWTHMALPWPLYYFHRFAPTRDSIFVHLSDGGQSENLGAYSLIRRGIPSIIISDHAQDRKGDMGDICRLKNQLHKQGLTLSIPGLANLEGVCSKSADSTLGYDIFNWHHPVLLGCVSNLGVTGASCIRPSNYSPEKGEFFSRLFIIKPALANPELAKALVEIAPKCKDKPDSQDCRSAIKSQCQPNLPVGLSEHTWRFSGALPCETLSFIMQNVFDKKQGIASDSCPHFPQHDTRFITVDSSPWIYGAMRELGSYYSRQIAWFFNDSATQNVDEQRFNNVLALQSINPLIPSHEKDHREDTQGKNPINCITLPANIQATR